MGRSEGVREQRAGAVALLVEGAGGGELAAVRDLLAGPLRTPVLLLRGDELHKASMTLDVDAEELEVDGRRVRPVVVWARHVSSGALPGSAPTGARQLADAKRLGLRTPRTLVTTDARKAASALDTRPVIVKTPDFRVLQPDPSTWDAYLPKVVDGSDAPDAPGHPVVVQEYLPHARELRVYHLDGAICAFEVGKPDPASPWTDPRSVTAAPAECPPPAAEAVRALCEAWGLRYGAFDLLVPRTGEPVFLEANPDGDWLWYERRARWRGVSFAAAVMVRQLYVRSTL